MVIKNWHFLFYFQVEYKTPRGFPQYLPRTLQREDYYFDIHRPWTEEFRRDNEIGRSIKKIYVEPIKDWCFFKGDRVSILNNLVEKLYVVYSMFSIC